MVDVHAGQPVADGPDQQRRHNGAVHAAGQGQQHLAVAHLGADQVDLVGDEVVHVPVLSGMAGLKEEVGQAGVPLRPVLGPGGQLNRRLRGRMIRRNHRNAQRVQLGRHVDILAVHIAVPAAVEDDSAHIRQRLQRLGRDVMRVNFGVNAQRANLAGQLRVLLASQVEDDDHILLHR